MSVIWNQFCTEKSRWEHESCPLSRIEKRPPLGGYISIKVMLDTIRNTTVVCCRETVLFSDIRNVNVRTNRPHDSMTDRQNPHRPQHVGLAQARPNKFNTIA